MSRVLFAGSEAECAAWRLAGVATRVIADATPAAALDSFEAALAAADLLLIDAQFAARLPAARIEAAQRAPLPLLLCLPPANARDSAPDLVRRARRMLSMDP